MSSPVVTLMQAVSILFGAVWMLVNFYNYYPLVQRRLDRTVAWLRRGGRRADTTTAEEVVAAAEELPTIDVLVAAYEESAVIEQPLRTLSQSTYPDDLVSIRVLVEPDDDATRSVLDSLRDKYDFAIETVPETYPGTSSKPRALNYGFEVTDGDVLTIIDAEDMVEAGYLTAVAAAVLDGAEFGMSRLDMVNEGDGWLNLLFRAEYGYWYNRVIPAFAHVDYPIPLGGTGCYFQRETLAAVAAERVERYDRVWNEAERASLDALGLEGLVPWDPTHLTEDFELGLFLWQMEAKFTYIDAVIEEESPIGLNAWLRQRTRWNKGKLQAFAHFVRYRPRTVRQQFHVYWQSILPHLGPINLLGLFFVFWVGNIVAVDPGILVQGVLLFGLTFTVLVTALYVRGYLLVSDAGLPVRLPRAAVLATTLAFYWFLQWLADLQAILDLRRGVTDWDKTAHVGRNSQGEIADASPVGAMLDVGQEVVDTAAAGVKSSSATRLPAIVVSRASDAANHDLVSTVSIRHSWPRRRVLGALLVLVAVGVSLRLGLAMRWSMWIDEVYTVSYRTQLPLSQLLYTPQDPHPPLYYVLVSGWMTVFENTHSAAVAFSVLCSVGTMVGTFLWARRLYDAPTGVVATGLVAISTLHLHFGRTVRMYSLLSMLVVASWYYYTRLWQAGPDSGGRLGYVVATAAMLYTHIFAIFVVLAQFAHAFVAATDREQRRSWGRLGVVLGVLYLPWAAVLLTQTLGFLGAEGDTGVSWIARVSQFTLRETFLVFAGYPRLYPVMAGTDLTLGAAAVGLTAAAFLVPFSVITYYRKTGTEYVLTNLGEAGLLAMAVVVPIAVPFVVSLLVLPIFVPRYAVAASMPFFLVVARGVLNVPSRKWRAGLVVVLLVTSAVGVGSYAAAETEEDWGAATAAIEQAGEPGDLLVLQPYWTLESVEYYYDGPPLETERLERNATVSAAEFDDMFAGHDTVWYVEYQSMGRANVELLEERYGAETAYDRGEITVYRVETTETARGNATAVGGSSELPQ